ncbi:hypothetical protein XENTR_v10024425 [Xenopus tropicalis]|nr:hypothetical protein XENTR_v10024425 [Xenopus tropicalis]
MSNAQTAHCRNNGSRIAQNGPKGILSSCYRALLELPTEYKHPFMERWEADLQINLTPEQWTTILEATSGATRCTNHLESHKKLFSDGT